MITDDSRFYLSQIADKDTMPYSITDARHRFSLWAAYRATQAGSAQASREELIPALEFCGVVSFLRTRALQKLEPSQYDALFEQWVTKARAYLRLKYRRRVSFGIAAKLVAIYVKSAFILGGHENSTLAHHISPPIDSKLLQGVDKRFGTSLDKNYKWTKLSRKTYREVLQELRRNIAGKPLWKIEEYWVL